MKKRIVSFLLALVMAVSLLPVSAFAVDGAYTVAKDAAVQQGDDADTIAVQAADGRYTINFSKDGVTADCPVISDTTSRTLTGGSEGRGDFSSASLRSPG